ncbi:MAG: 30S ribosome-binding factor RbfA [Actinomycetota bacterium]
MGATSRMRKVNSVLREVLADEIELLTDPRVEMVSVTGVDTSPDLRRAVVYVSTLDLEAGPDAVAALNHAAPRLQAAVARQVRIKYTPQLEFTLDSGVVHGERIDRILRGLHTEVDRVDEEE